MMKYQNITLEDWDNLIILDACRFDFFKKVYKEYLDGKLEKRLSKGSCTGEWLVKTFPDTYNYTYISASPYINSYGVPLNKCTAHYKNYLWNAVEHFTKIIDVWEFGYTKEFDTIHPREINKAYLSNKDDKKTIIHYMQPHQPYLSYNGVFQNSKMVKLIKDIYLNFIPKTSLKFIKPSLVWPRIYKLFNKDHKAVSKLVISEEFGIDNLYYYYEDNLRIVLKYVSQLIDELDGITLITADHGEAFGEQGIWAHPMETHIPVLTEVPWLEVKN